MTAADPPDRTQQRADSDDAADGQRARFRPDDIGRTLGKATAVSVVSFFLSAIGLVLYAGALPEEDPTIGTFAPPVIALAASWAGLWISLFGYGVWSVWQLRKRSTDRETDRMRRKRAVLAFVLGTFAFLLPVAMVHGSPRGG